ncbi:hypothetical protein BN1723_019913, partial [Verticillium longisporum]
AAERSRKPAHHPISDGARRQRVPDQVQPSEWCHQ